MRAIYQSTQAYLSLSYHEVNNFSPAMSDGHYDKQGRYIAPHIIGSCVEFPVDKNYKFYYFMEGEKHNQLTLTDPTEIRNMRAYIKRRGDMQDLQITEIIFEGEEADLEVIVPVEQIEQEKPVERSSNEKDAEEELSDWDKRLLNNMLNR